MFGEGRWTTRPLRLSAGSNREQEAGELGAKDLNSRALVQLVGKLHNCA